MTQIEENKARVDAFLADLAEISRKHDLWISGCGCCESPWIATPNWLRRSEHPLMRYKADVNDHANVLADGLTPAPAPHVAP